MRGALVAVYGARPSGVASSLARAIGALGVGAVGLAELDPRVLRARADGVMEPTRRPPDERGPQRAADEVDRDETRNGRARRISAEVDAWLAPLTDDVWVLAALGRPRSPGLADAKSVAAALDALRQLVAVGVIELERQVNERTLAALDAAERVLLVTQGSVPSLRGTQRILRLCRRLNYPDEKLCVVVLPSDAPGALSVADIAGALRRPVYWTISDTESFESYEGLAGRLMLELREIGRA